MNYSNDMRELIPVSYDNPERPTVSGRELHDFLEIKTAYKDWFPRMCEYGFTEGEDFNPLRIERVQDEGGRMVSSRNNIPRKRFDEAVEYIQRWKPSTNTVMLIQQTNGQTSMF